MTISKELFIPRPPKRSSDRKTGRIGFYKFYPGFSSVFVDDVLRYWQLPSGSTVLDPWNGSGTTSEVATALGYQAVGYDLNPVMFIVAKARMVSKQQSIFLTEKKHHILKRAKRYRKHPLLENDPLNGWFADETVNAIRCLERAIQAILLHSTTYKCLLDEQQSLCSLPSEVAFFYLGLFRTLKGLSFSFRSSNPTWIKKPTSMEDRPLYDKKKIWDSFENHVDDMLEIVRNNPDSGGSARTPILGIADSQNLPLAEASADAIISSPPYCTRIDYAVMTRLELALMGCDEANLKHIRSQLIGSPLTNGNNRSYHSAWGETCKLVIDAIKTHDSKASETYYMRTYVQYFFSIYQSLLEMDRVLKNGGRCALVVQNSYYKDVYIDLGNIFIEMAKSVGWHKTDQFDYASKQTMLWINTKSTKYRGKKNGKEIVLFFHKRRR